MACHTGKKIRRGGIMSNRIPWLLLVSSVVIGVVITFLHGALIGLIAVGIYALTYVLAGEATKWFYAKRWAIAALTVIVLYIFTNLWPDVLFSTMPGIAAFVIGCAIVLAILGGENTQIPS